jgi:hypothetical protein
LFPAKKNGYRAEGTLTHDGTFTVNAFATQEGAVPGNYIVTIRPKVETKGAPAKGAHVEKVPPPQIPAKYLNPNTSDIEVKVREGETDLGTIRLVHDKPAAKKR